MVTNHRCPDVSLSQKEERELSDLFNKLDVNRDGHIDVNDLTAAFQNLDVPRFPGHIKVYMLHNNINIAVSSSSDHSILILRTETQMACPFTIYNGFCPQT